MVPEDQEELLKPFFMEILAQGTRELVSKHQGQGILLKAVPDAQKSWTIETCPLPVKTKQVSLGPQIQNIDCSDPSAHPPCWTKPGWWSLISGMPTTIFFFKEIWIFMIFMEGEQHYQFIFSFWFTYCTQIIHRISDFSNCWLQKQGNLHLSPALAVCWIQVQSQEEVERALAYTLAASRGWGCSLIYQSEL